MEAIKLIGTSHNGKLIVSVPEEFDEKELELMIISSKEMKKDKESVIVKKKEEQLMGIVGGAKHPGFTNSKYEVHD